MTGAKSTTGPARDTSGPAEGPGEHIRNALQILGAAREALSADDSITAEHHIQAATRRLALALVQLAQRDLFG